MAVQQDRNPFAAPSVQDNQNISLHANDRLKPHFAWLCMLVINLPMPLYFGFGVTGKSGWIGMLSGIAAVYLCGLWSCTTWPRIMYRLNIGSSLVAASQFFPMLHIFVGTTAVSISKMVFRGTEWVDILEWQGGDMTGLAEISFATILTGIGLIIPSVVLGTIIVALLGLDKDGRRLT